MKWSRNIHRQSTTLHQQQWVISKHADAKYARGLKSMQPFGKCTAVTDCELSITGTLMTHLLTVERKCMGFFFFLFFFNGVWVEGCRLMVCRSLLCPSQRRLTVWIEIVCSCGYACQLLHGICIIQQPGVLRGARAKGEGTRHGEESTPRKREHGSGGVLEICSMLWRAY